MSRAHKSLIESIYIGAITRLTIVIVGIMIKNFNYDFTLIFEVLFFMGLSCYYYLVHCCDREPLSQFCDKYIASIIKIFVLWLCTLITIHRMVIMFGVGGYPSGLRSTDIIYDMLTLGFDIEYVMMLGRHYFDEYQEALKLHRAKAKIINERRRDQISQLV